MTRFDTIVVGAGISGSTAARLLHRAGQRVVVLEARDRVGGRVWTVRTDGTILDVGASWIHGIDNNPLADAVRAFGIRTAEFTVGSYQPDGRPIAYYSPAGIKLSDADAAQFAADIHHFDAGLAATVAEVPPGTSFEEAVEVTLRQLDWGRDRLDRVREFVGHRAEDARAQFDGKRQTGELDGVAHFHPAGVFKNLQVNQTTGPHVNDLRFQAFAIFEEDVGDFAVHDGPLRVSGADQRFVHTDHFTLGFFHRV